jgi:hypothetical protein
MATVYRAHDPGIARDVAIKVLPREFLDVPGFRARFEREARMLASLEHPAIVPIYDHGEHEGQPYLVMRLMSGGSLADRLRNGPLPIPEAARILSALAPALDHAHASEIIHRDLKPSNILFDRHGNPYLADFGIARMLEASTLTTASGLMGTPAYMSPEQVSGKIELDGRSDLYALGVMVFEMLAGQLPYKADTPISMAVQHVQAPVPRLRAVRPELPVKADQIISKALAKQREARYADAVSLARDVASLPSPSSPPRPVAAKADKQDAKEGAEAASKRGPATQAGGLARMTSVLNQNVRTHPRLAASVALLGAMALLAIVGVVVFALLISVLPGLSTPGTATPGNTPAPTGPALANETLRVPAATAPVAADATATLSAVATTATSQQPTAEGVGGGGPACNFRPEPASGFAYGIQSHVFGGGDQNYFLGVVSDRLGFNWVKMQVRWVDLQPNPGEILWGLLDGAMDATCDKGLRVMLSIVAAPTWTQADRTPAGQGQGAPPDDPQDLADFVSEILDRYPGRVGAIEVWNEQNLEREWNTTEGIDPAAYVALLRATYEAVKAADPDVVVISGALSPTGITCHVSFPNCPPTGRPIVVDDVTYLRGFISARGLDVADCVGVHSNGTNLPPTADGAHPPPPDGYTFSGPWDNPHYSWALRSQVETYDAILAGRKPQCVTEFGYAAAVDGLFPPNYGFAADITEDEQAQYLVDAFNWMRDTGHVKMAFLFNLDYGPLGGDPSVDDNAIFSILRRDGSPRPAFDALQVMPKP